MHLLDLPKEIIKEIFLNTPRNDLLQCSLTCKDLSTTALQAFYRDVKLTAENIQVLNPQLLLEANERDGYFRYGAFVLSLEILDDIVENTEEDNDGLEDLIYEDIFITLLEYLPNLEVLNIKESVFAEQYLDFLLNTQSTSCLNRIRLIDYDENPFQQFNSSNIVDLHFLVCYKYRATINDLVIHYKHLINDVDSQRDRTLTFLRHFENVEYLTLINSCDDALDVLDITNIFPNLISLQYKSNRIMSDNHAAVDSTNDKMNRCLKNLVLEVPTVSTRLIKYIIDYVPKQIDAVHITMSNIDVCDWISTVGISDALKFVSHLGTFKVTDFNFEPPKSYKRQSVQEESKSTLLFKLLGAFKGNKKNDVHAFYDDFSSVHDTLAYNPTYGFTAKIGSKVDNRGSYNESKINLEFPNTQSSIIGLETITHMHAIMYDKRPELQTYFLQQALNRCPELLGFEFRYSLNLYRGVRLTTSKSKNKLNVMKIGDYLPAEGDYVDLFATHLPNLEVLSVGSPGKSRQALTSPATIDLRSFKDLQKFYFNLEILLGRRSKDGVHITLCYDDGSSKGYSQLKGTQQFVEKTGEAEASDDWFYHPLTIHCHKGLEIYIYSDDDTFIAEIGEKGYVAHNDSKSILEKRPFFM